MFKDEWLILIDISLITFDDDRYIVVDEAHLLHYDQFKLKNDNRQCFTVMFKCVVFIEEGMFFLNIVDGGPGGNG